MSPERFEPPVYPYERLERARRAAMAHEGGIVDLSVGTPCDAPPPEVVAALSGSHAERGYPESVGGRRYREAAAGWLERRFGVSLAPEAVAACVGTKEMVASTPRWLRMRTPERDTVLYPSLSYPTYAMGATLGECRAVAVRVTKGFRLDLEAISESDAERAVMLWVNTPGNPAGQLEDLAEVVAWGRRHGIPVFSDECYTEFTWSDRPRTALEQGTAGVVCLHSLSKRSNLAGLRAGFYAGDTELVTYLSEVRKHAGLLVPGPVQTAAAVALADDEHVRLQRARYEERIRLFSRILGEIGAPASAPEGGFYLWVRAPGADVDPRASWAFTESLASRGGALVSPGDLYGEPGGGYVRVALVQPVERLGIVAERLGVA